MYSPEAPRVEQLSGCSPRGKFVNCMPKLSEQIYVTVVMCPGSDYIHLIRLEMLQ